LSALVLWLLSAALIFAASWAASLLAFDANASASAASAVAFICCCRSSSAARLSHSFGYGVLLWGLRLGGHCCCWMWCLGCLLCGRCRLADRLVVVGVCYQFFEQPG